MCRELASSGTKEPHYQLVAFIMKSTVYASILTDDGTTQKEAIKITSVLEYIRQHPKANRMEIAGKLMNITEDGVKYNLKVLQQKGLLKRVGSD